MTGTQYDVDVVDLTAYLREISQYPLLTPQEELCLARQMDEGAKAARKVARRRRSASTPEKLELELQIAAGLAARQRLIESNLRLVVSIAGRHRGRGLSLQDLIQEGNIGLQSGIERFDWRKGYRLSTYVYWWIRQAMTRALANDSRTIRLPVHAGEMLRSAAQAEQDLSAELGRAPTLEETAKRAGVQPERLRAIRFAASAPESLDAPLSSETTLTRADGLADDHAGDALDFAEHVTDLQESISTALDRLPERERNVVKLHYGVGTPRTWTLAEIGECMGVTRERARQIESQALRRLRNNAQLRRALVELTGT
jgi:RNA polymerase primary sigma factor